MARRATKILLVALILILLPLETRPSGVFDGYHEETAPTGKVYWRGWSAAERKIVLDLLPDAVSRAESRLRRPGSGPFTTVLVPDGHELRREADRLLGVEGALPRGWNVAGVAFPGPRVLMVRGDFLPGAGSFSSTLEHEVAHLVIHGKPGARIPLWFDEGVATWIADPVLPRDAESSMSLLARLGALFALSSLDTRFPGAQDPASIAYRQSLLFITYLVEKHGEGVIPDLLDRFEKGLGGEEALAAVASRPASKIEADFAAWVVRRASLFQALLSVISLWTIAALLAVAAYVRYRIRRRRRLASLGDEPAPDEPARVPET